MKQSRLFALCVLISTIFLLPQLTLHYPNLLDISETYFYTNKFNNLIKEFSNPERFRPIYVLTRIVFNIIGNYHIQYYFVTAIMILAVTTNEMITIVTGNRLRYLPACIMILLFYISPVTVDTYWRIGTAENVFTLLLLVALYGALRSKYALTVCFAILLMLAKETSVFYIPIFLLFFIYKRRLIETIILTIGYIAYLLQMHNLIQSIQIRPTFYVGLFSLSATSITDMFWYYIITQLYYLLLFFASIVLLCIRIYKKHIVFSLTHWEREIFIISLVIISIISLTIFHHKNQLYYFFPSLTIIIIYYGWEVHRASKNLQIASLVYAIALFCLFQVGTETYKRAVHWHEDYRGDEALIEHITKHATTHKYMFNTFYRDDYNFALELLNRCTDPQTCIPTTVYSYKSTELNSSAIPLCAKRTSICKWAIQEQK